MRGLALAIVACVATLLSSTEQARAEMYRLDYEAAVLGVLVLGTARYEVTADTTRYAARANIRTSGVARLFDQTDISAASTGTISSGGIAWTRYDLSHAYASKFRRIQMRRAGGEVTSEITPNYTNMGAPPASAAQRLGSYDPVTAVFVLGRQVGAARACRGATLVFDGRQHYRLAIAPRTFGNFNSGGYSGPAVLCRFRYEPIAGFNMSPQERTNLPVGELWFALPQQATFAPPLRLAVPTPLGNAVLDLRNYERLN